MRVDSLSELQVAFAGWRRGKRYRREAVPDDLLKRARCAAEVHGVREVVRAVRIEQCRLLGHRRGEKPTRSVAVPVVRAVPAFSRLELAAPILGAQPVAELATPAGLKLRVFTESPAMVGLLSRLCGVGGTG